MTVLQKVNLACVGFPFLMTNGPTVWIVLKISKNVWTMWADLIKAEDENAIWEFFDNGRKKRKEMEITKKVAWKVP